MHVLIVGGGKVGAQLARNLIDDRHGVSIIEARSDTSARLSAEFGDGIVFTGSGTDPAILEAAGIHRARVVAAVTGADEVNLVAMSLARYEFGVARTIARINNRKNAWMFTPEMGVDVALNPSDLLARLIAEEMSLGDMMTLIKLRRGQIALVEERVHPRAIAAGHTIGELSLPKNCIPAAILREGTLIIPRADTMLLAGDELLAIVHASAAAELAALLTEPS